MSGVSGIARIGVFAALAFGLNSPFLAVPNVEVFSLTIFLSGLFMGKASGTAVAFVAGIIFVFFNPNGPQPIPLVGFVQIFGFMVFGFSGGLARPILLNVNEAVRAIWLMTLLGIVLTLCYDLLTNLAFAYLFGPFWPALIGGLGFSLVHIICNAVIFGLTGAVVNRIWKRIEFVMPPLAG